MLIGLVAIGEPLLRWIGPEFAAGYWALLLLAAAEGIQGAYRRQRPHPALPPARLHPVDHRRSAPPSTSPPAGRSSGLWRHRRRAGRLARLCRRRPGPPHVPALRLRHQGPAAPRRRAARRRRRGPRRRARPARLCRSPTRCAPASPSPAACSSYWIALRLTLRLAGESLKLDHFVLEAEETAAPDKKSDSHDL